jgi:hypothetical protein
MTRAEVKAAAMQELTDHIDKMCADMEEEFAAAIQTQRDRFTDAIAKQRVRIM